MRSVTGWVACATSAGRATVTGLTAGTGGNIRARDGGVVWMKPTGFAMDELTARNICGMDLKTGRQVKGPHRPTCEVNMHLAVYRVRPDVKAVFHVHSPWATGVISTKMGFKLLLSEMVLYAGRMVNIPFYVGGAKELAEHVGDVVAENDVVFMTNHGVLAVGATIRESYHRCLVVEDAGKSMVAAMVVGGAKFLTKKQIGKLRGAH